MTAAKRSTPASDPAPAHPKPAGLLSGFARLDDWREQHAGPFFPTRASLVWFVRNHRVELVGSGALLLGEGKTGSVVDCAKFAEAVVEIKRRASRGKLPPDP